MESEGFSLANLFVVGAVAYWLVSGGIKIVRALSGGVSTKDVGSSKPLQGLPPNGVVPGEPSRPGAVAFDKDAVRKRILAVTTAASELSAAISLERANRRFVHTLQEWVPQNLQSLQALSENPALPLSVVDLLLGRVEMVVQEIGILVAQRRDPTLLPLLGDADTLADACYAPVIAFAKAEGFGLTTGYPATQLSEFDLSIWTGFIPTSIAPIFLPQDFFLTAFYWPAIAHEIGHDFLASVDGLGDGLRRDLGLCKEDEGATPVALQEDGSLNAGDLERLYGLWFEELFCDVFATLMCGPSYAVTMIELFACQDEPDAIVTVQVRPDRRGYDCHPPRHLRLWAALFVLERSGFAKERGQLWKRWCQRHGGEGDPSHLLLPLSGTGGVVRIRLEWFQEKLTPMLEALYDGSLPGLKGRGLTAVSGLDYGPHEHAEAERAKDHLLLGKVPTVRDPRAVIAGVVLATVVAPNKEAEILQRGRAAIVAMGTNEHRLDAYSTPEEAKTPSPLGDRSQLVVEGLLLSEILKRRNRTPSAPALLRFPRR